MPNKKSIKRVAVEFIDKSNELERFFTQEVSGLSEKQQSWCYDYAIIRLYREFEQLMLKVIVGAINHDSTVISSTKGVNFPKHMSNEVCEYLVLGGGYFDFKGRDGLIKTLKKFVPDAHYILVAVRKAKYRQTLERLSALRNYAAHESLQSKRSVLLATGQERIGTSGSWLKVQGRYSDISSGLRDLAQEIHDNAPR